MEVTDRRAQLETYFVRLHDDRPGWIMAASGTPQLAPNGKLIHPDFAESAFAWPREAARLVDFLLETSGAQDCWATPGLSHNPLRTMNRRRSLPSRHLWVDLDGATGDDLARLEHVTGRGGFQVSSGRGPGHVHGYVALLEPAPAEQVAVLNRRLVLHVHGDPSPSALNGYLRPPGTWNFKPAILTGSAPASVVLCAPYKCTEFRFAAPGPSSGGGAWAVDELERILPALPERAVVAGVITGPLPEVENLPGRLPVRVAAILADRADTPMDRSVRLMQLVRACDRMAWTPGQVLAVARAHAPSVAKYGRRLDAETLRCIAKDSQPPLCEEETP